MEPTTMQYMTIPGNRHEAMTSHDLDRTSFDRDMKEAIGCDTFAAYDMNELGVTVWYDDEVWGKEIPANVRLTTLLTLNGEGGFMLGTVVLTSNESRDGEVNGLDEDKVMALSLAANWGIEMWTDERVEWVTRACQENITMGFVTSVNFTTGETDVL